MNTRYKILLPLLAAFLLPAATLWQRTALAQASCAAPPSGMVAWFPGDGNAGDLAGRVGGTAQNGASYATGRVSQAFSFNGVNSTVVVPNSSAIQLTDAITIEAWVNPSSISQDAGAGIVAHGSFRRGAYAIDILSPGTLRFFFYDSGEDNPAFQVRKEGWLTSAKVNTWSHIAATYDSTSGALRLYDNGVLIASSTAPTGTKIGVNDHELSIGSRQSSGTGGGTGAYDLSFAGLVDEVKIFNRALTLAEVQSINNAGSAGVCRSCVAQPALTTLWLPFDASAGDLSGRAAAALEGGATFTAAGKVAGALDLSAANGQVRITPNGTSLDYGSWSAQTIEFWINWGGPKTTPQPGLTLGPRQYVWDNRGVLTDAFAVIVIDESGAASGSGLKALGHPAPGSFNTGGEVQAVAPLPTVGVWEHYACVFDKTNGRISIYKNGTLVANQTSWTPRVGTSAGSKTVGNVAAASSVTNDFHLRGKLDELRIYNRALSASEIQQAVNSSGTGMCRSSRNNNFANASFLSGPAGAAFGVNVGATKEAGEPSHGGRLGGASVWYRWQAPSNGRVLLSTAGSSFDTLLGVYTGTQVSALTQVAGNDDSTFPELDGYAFTSRLTFNAVAGTVYYFAVDGAGATGQVALDWYYEAEISGTASYTQVPDAEGNMLGCVGANCRPCSIKVTLSGDQASVLNVFGGSGTYRFRHLPVGGNYSVKAEFNNCTPASAWVPQSRPFTALAGDMSGANFAGTTRDGGENTVCPGPQCTVSIAGRIRSVTSFVGMSAVVSGTTSTGASIFVTKPVESNGTFTFSSIPNGSYTLTPQSPLHVFSPSAQPFNGENDRLQVDFTATEKFSISGKVLSGGSPLAGVTVALSNSDMPSVLTGADGLYSFLVLKGGTHTVTPSKTGLTFEPPFVEAVNVTSSRKDTDFNAVVPLRLDTISPRAGRAMGGQSVALTGSFPAISAVNFGGTAAAIVSQSATRLVVTTPEHTPGAVAVEIVPASGSTTTMPNGFAYLRKVFTDDVLTARETEAKIEHVLELREAVDTLRRVANLAPAQWGEPLVRGALIRAAHIRELRMQLQAVAPAFGFSFPATEYEDPDLGVEGVIRHIHIEELRQRIRTIAG